jgi:hypothetical protein
MEAGERDPDGERAVELYLQIAARCGSRIRKAATSPRFGFASTATTARGAGAIRLSRSDPHSSKPPGRMGLFCVSRIRIGNLSRDASPVGGPALPLLRQISSPLNGWRAAACRTLRRSPELPAPDRAFN